MLRKTYPDITFSSVYKTAARDEQDQDDFLNAVAKIETDDAPEEVFDVLQKIEKKLEKNPPYPKGPRTIDLDMLLYGDESLELWAMGYEIIVPHPRMKERRFVLEPLCELLEGRSMKLWNVERLKILNQKCERIRLQI